ncbi:MAG: hypothetical protein PHU07_06835 [Acidocella sp.]|nr:hypothetical protein [Acidocella sp.]
MFARGSKTNYIDYLLLILIFVGGVNAFEVVFHGNNLESDTASSAMLWQGVHQYGWGFLRTWRFTTDGWQFSLLPFHFSLLYIFGAKPTVIIAFGWVIFIACVITTYYLTLRVSGNRRLALIVALLLSWANPGALLTAQGSLGYPIAHNISILYCSVSLICLVHYIQSRNSLLFVFADMFMILSCISDPWADVAFLLPVVAGSLLLLFCKGGRQYLGLLINNILVAAFIVAYFRTSGFGLFDYLAAPITHVSSDVLKRNFDFLCSGIAGYFNVNISGGVNNTLLYIGPDVFAMVFALCTFSALSLTLKRFRVLPLAEFFCLMVFLLSAIGSIAAYLLLFVSVAPWSARYFDTAFVFAPAYVLLSFRRSAFLSLPVFKAAGILFAMLFVVSGAQASRHFWSSKGLSVEPALSIARFLQSNNLTYGYGDYWGAEANAVSWITKGDVLVRPVRFNGVSGRVMKSPVGQVSSLWYQSVDQRDKSRTFIVFTNHADDTCQPLEKCIDAAKQQIGVPDQILMFNAYGDDYYVLVWNRPILDRLDNF